MPYIIKKFKKGYKVCKKFDQSKCFSNRFLSKEMAKKQMQAIGAQSHMRGRGKQSLFKGQLIFFGCGAVAKSVLYLLDNFIKVNPKKMFIFDLKDYSNHPDVKKYIDKGATYKVIDLNVHYEKIIDNLNPYDIIIDLTCMTDSHLFMTRCKKNNIRYINTSLEDKDSVSELRKKEGDSFNNTYQHSHNEINELKKKFPENLATMEIINGANPGLISSFIKYGLLFMCSQLKKISKEMKLYIENREYGKICKELKVAVIHCSETDSSHYLDHKNFRVFTNTWCVDGFVQEGSANCEFTYGSNQLEMPKDSKLLHDHIIELDKPALEVYCESYVPVDGKIIGIVIPHSEGISSSVFFSDGTYCPTQHYVYRIPPVAYESINKFYPKSKYGDTVKESHVLNNLDDKFEGIDRLGALILTDDGKAVWCGSMLDNKDVGLHSGTTQQVACSILSGVKYMLKYPDLGIVFPEELDEDFIIETCKPYLGEFFCDFVPYKPDSIQFKDLVKTKEQFGFQFASKIKKLKGGNKKCKCNGECQDIFIDI